MILLPFPLIASALLAAATPAPDPRRDWFEFVVPDLAGPATQNSPIDLSFLSPEPAGAHGFLRAEGGRLVDGRGVPVRLFGTNICDFHPMPPREDAPRIALRLRQLGINFVRLHYYEWAPAPKGIVNADMQTLDPAKLDQFHFLVAELARCGVYVDVNLHVARGYPGLPAGWDWMGKALDRVHGEFVESQRRFARDLLTAPNPYTGRPLAAEPAVAAFEINNENSVFQSWLEFAGLPERFSGPLRSAWNAWLRKEHGNTAALRAAWKAGLRPGPELLGDPVLGPEGWEAQNSGGGESRLALADVPADGPANGPAVRVLRWEAAKAGTAWWHIQFYRSGVAAENGKRYVLRFRARSPESLQLEIRLMHQREPWRGVTNDFLPRLGPEWKEYSVSLLVDNPEGVPVRLNVGSRNETGTVEIEGISLREGVVDDFGKGESLEAGTVALGRPESSHLRLSDYARFLAGLERENSAAIARFLRQDLGVKSLVWDTQVDYGGLWGLLRETSLADAIDTHSYPGHPSASPGEGWSWTIRNASLLGGCFGGLEWMAFRRVAGMPFFCTEFDLNPPNDHNAETVPMLALLASYQDWNGIAEYSWLNFQEAGAHDRMTHNFHTTGNAGQMATIPAAALMFRLGLVKPAERAATLDLPADSVPRTMSRRNPWFGTADLWTSLGGRPEHAWLARLSVSLTAGGGAAAATGLPPVPAGPLASDTGEISLDRTAGREHMAVNAPAFRMLLGRVGGRRFALGDVSIEVTRGNAGYANVTLAALDGAPVARSRKLLLTALARVENRGQEWNADRTAVRWGEGPTLAEPVVLTLSLPRGDWRARALDGNGRPGAVVPVRGGRLATAARYRTVWYLIERAGGAAR